MRPLELTVEGFRSYRTRTTFDWRSRRLVGIVGPIGAGKSSILDAISFALYGKTPQERSATKSLIHQLADQSHVELRFQVDGRVWRAVRSLRRKGASGHQLELLASDEPDADVLESVVLEGAMNERIQQLLGMDFETFCRSVLLAQNRFAEFLRAGRTDRDKVLKGVFGLERLDDALRVARSRFDRADLELAALDRERERVTEARDRLEQARDAAERARERLTALEAAEPEVERLDKERQAATAEAEASDARIASLEEIAKTLPTTTELESAVEAALDADARVGEAKAALDKAGATVKLREVELADVASRHGDREQFRSFEHLVRAHERQVDEVAAARAEVERADAEVASARSVLEERTASAASAAEAVAAADGALGSASDAVTVARVALMDGMHLEMAKELRGTLALDEPCPVCRQVVHALPKAGAAPKVASAERALAKAEGAESTRREQRERASAAEASARTAVEEAASAIEKAVATQARTADASAAVDASLAATKSQLVEWLGEEGDVRALFEAREAELAAAEQALAEARATVDRARSALDEIKQIADGVGAQIATLANKLAGAWGRLEEDRAVAAAPDRLRAEFVAIGEALVERSERAAAQGVAARDRIEETAATRVALFESLELALADDFRRALTEAGVAHGTAASVVSELEDRIAAASDLEREVLAAEERRGIAKRLADDLQPSRFLNFLLVEERSELAELGSDHFEQLTDGAFRFTEDDRFEILEYLNAAGSKRKADSLSGGETFLASLALALALAEMVARGGGRLDAFFLDEGFGSLDPEHIDRAMEGIGRLVASDTDRIVVLVSHVAEMREAIEDLIVLDKHDVTGDTIVRSGAVSGS